MCTSSELMTGWSAIKKKLENLAFDIWGNFFSESLKGFCRKVLFTMSSELLVILSTIYYSFWAEEKKKAIPQWFFWEVVYVTDAVLD